VILRNINLGRKYQNISFFIVLVNAHPSSFDICHCELLTLKGIMEKDKYSVYVIFPTDLYQDMPETAPEVMVSKICKTQITFLKT